MRQKRGNIVIGLALCLTLLIGQEPSVAAVHDVQEAIASRSKEDIMETWRSYIPTALEASEKDLFEEQPEVQAPFFFGQVKPEVLQDGLKAVNFARYLAGLPDDVTLDESLTEQQQAGAIILAHIGKGLTHYPPQPETMPDDVYELASQSTRTSNVYAGRSSLFRSVLFGYMSDRSANNIETVGHRRWILNPAMAKTMFGLAYNENSDYRFYSTMYAFNQDRPESDVRFDYIAWPSAGYFPIEVFHPLDPWSVSLDSSVYNRDRIDEISVTLTRERDQRVWELDASDRDVNGDYYNVETSYYGLNFAIIFRPGDIGEFEPDDRFRVEIDNLYLTATGKRTSISYETTFFHLSAKFALPYWRPHYFAVGDTFQFPLTMQPLGVQSTDPKVAALDETGTFVALEQGFETISVDPWFSGPGNSTNVYVASVEWKISDWAIPEVKKAAAIGLLNENPYYSWLTVPITRRGFVNYTVGMLSAHDQGLEAEIHKPKSSPFRDVGDFESEIIWAHENGLIDGIGDGLFDPDANITREQAAALLLRVYRYMGGTGEEGYSFDLARFVDEPVISAWAKSSVQQIAGLSIMNGVAEDRFDPQGEYSKEQTIVTLLRLYQRFHDGDF